MSINKELQRVGISKIKRDDSKLYTCYIVSLVNCPEYQAYINSSEDNREEAEDDLYQLMDDIESKFEVCINFNGYSEIATVDISTKEQAHIIAEQAELYIEKAIQDDEGYSVLVKDKHSNISIWVDIWDGTWDYNQTIFNLHNEADCIYRELQPLLVEEIDYLIDDYVVMTCEEEVNV